MYAYHAVLNSRCNAGINDRWMHIVYASTSIFHSLNKTKHDMKTTNTHYRPLLILIKMYIFLSQTRISLFFYRGFRSETLAQVKKDPLWQISHHSLVKPQETSIHHYGWVSWYWFLCVKRFNESYLFNILLIGTDNKRKILNLKWTIIAIFNEIIERHANIFKNLYILR